MTVAYIRFPIVFAHVTRASGTSVFKHCLLFTRSSEGYRKTFMQAFPPKLEFNDLTRKNNADTDWDLCIIHSPQRESRCNAAVASKSH